MTKTQLSILDFPNKGPPMKLGESYFILLTIFQTWFNHCRQFIFSSSNKVELQKISSITFGSRLFKKFLIWISSESSSIFIQVYDVNGFLIFFFHRARSVWFLNDQSSEILKKVNCEIRGFDPTELIFFCTCARGSLRAASMELAIWNI